MLVDDNDDELGQPVTVTDSFVVLCCVSHAIFGLLFPPNFPSTSNTPRSTRLRAILMMSFNDESLHIFFSL